jgi:TnpA family transposase
VLKVSWTEDDLAAEWLLQPAELNLLRGRRDVTRLGFAMQLKFFQMEGRFPTGPKEFANLAVQFVAKQLELPVDIWIDYPWTGRTIKYQRAEIRQWLGFRESTLADHKLLQDWLLANILDQEQRMDVLKDVMLTQCRTWKIEPPATEQIRRLIRSALQEHEAQFCARVIRQLDDQTIESLDELLEPIKPEMPDEETTNNWSIWQSIKSEPGKVGLACVLQTKDRLERIRKLNLPPDLFKNVPPKLIARYARRASVEEPFELRRHSQALRVTLLTTFLHERTEELTDHLVDLLIEITHKMGKRAENRVEESVLTQLKKVPKKLQILFQIAEASLSTPKGAVEDVIYPIASEELLRDILQEIQMTGPAYKSTIQKALQRSYRSHYRRMLPVILNTLEFRCTNSQRQPVMQALMILKQYLDHKGSRYPKDVEPPIDGVVRSSWMSFVVEKDDDEKTRVNRVAYEICVLKALRDQLRCREIWVIGSRRYRNPDEDLPQDFDAKRETYYAELSIPINPTEFTASLREEMQNALQMFNDGLPSNQKVKIISKKKRAWIKVSPLDAQPEPENTGKIKAVVGRRWPMTSLLDMLKETDMRTHFSECFHSPTAYERLDPVTLQRRLLFCLYGMGTNTGLKRIASGQDIDGYKELLYVRHRFVSVPQLRQAIAKVVNATLAVRLPHIWGEATTSCAADSKQFQSWDHNLLTEWHLRYGGRGVMVYWHVDKNSCCIYSQLKRVSSSEASAMIQGVIRHCTEMRVKQQFVDSHGQTEVAFAFCRLLGFELMPRLKNIHKQKLYRHDASQSDAFSELQEILSSPIKWELIDQELDAMVKHIIALKMGMADAESLLRRFTRTNIQHPTYKAFSELGKVIKTIFLCKYLHNEQIRREIHEGLNVVESWNSANDFIMIGKGGELTSNRQEDQEISLLCLHLLQSSLVYINTLMIQDVLEDKALLDRLTARDHAALSPLFTSHVNPFGRFELDLDTRIPLNC